MRIALIFAMVSLLAMAGCQRPPHSSPVATSTAPGACPTYKVQLAKCKDTGNPPKVTIDTVKMEFDPEYVCSKKGRTIEFILDPPPEDNEGTAVIFPKDFKESPWLVGTNSPAKNKIKIKVPDWVGEKTYSYNFMKKDGSCVDPRVEVTR